MIGYILSFIFGIFLAQEYNIPNVKNVTREILNQIKKWDKFDIKQKIFYIVFYTFFILLIF